MQVIVKGRHTHVSSNLKELATHKLEKIARFFDRIQRLEVEFSEEHNPRIADRKHTVEITLSTKKHVLRAHASGPDPGSAIDRAAAKLQEQVKRMKGRWVRRGERASGKAEVERGISGAKPPAEAPEPLAARNGPEREIQSDEVEAGESGAPLIQRVKRFALKPMTTEEAVLQMETLGHDFFLFLNAESEQAGVVYRRRDGSFGLIEPE